jgi:glycosyltransferase involved in cell wall biosynthesis
MRILMLGWEFPPFIAGGLGVACYGLTKALDRAGHQVVFVLPKPVNRALQTHVKLLSPLAVRGATGTTTGGSDDQTLTDPSGLPLAGFKHAIFKGVPATFTSPYPGFNPTSWFQLTDPEALKKSGLTAEEAAAMGLDINTGELNPAAADAIARGAALEAAAALTASNAPAGPKPMHIGSGGGAGEGYGSDLFGDAQRYANLVVALARQEQFEVVHAHDWLTFPAALALAKITSRPLVVHVHSTEFDRSGNNVNQRIYDIERAGMHGADRVVCVSQFTKSICVRRYGIPPSKIDVCYNGLDRESYQPAAESKIESTDKIVLFLGRITMQKGPEYFIAAAKRVLEKVPNAKFVLAGSGDMALRMIDMAANLGIGHKVLFTGFLKGKDVDRIFQMADCYVMPSVSEPFGLAALEAIHHDVPVILSKTSGASEVLTHVLKVDFWDIDEMANKIVAVLRHPPLSQTLREHGSFELQRLTWEGAAEKVVDSYAKASTARRLVTAV